MIGRPRSRPFPTVTARWSPGRRPGSRRTSGSARCGCTARWRAARRTRRPIWTSRSRSRTTASTVSPRHGGDWLAAITPTLIAPPIAAGSFYAITPVVRTLRRHRRAVSKLAATPLTRRLVIFDRGGLDKLIPPPADPPPDPAVITYPIEGRCGRRRTSPPRSSATTGCWAWSRCSRSRCSFTSCSPSRTSRRRRLAPSSGASS